jgi:hypothetical protein
VRERYAKEKIKAEAQPQYGSLPFGIPIQVDMQLVFSGDSEWHYVDIREKVTLVWDEQSQVLTVRLEHSSEHAAQDLFWEMLKIVPKLRADRR